MPSFLRLSFFACLISVSTVVSARAPDVSVATNLPQYIVGDWCLNKEVVKAYDANDSDDISYKGEIWNFSKEGNYTFNGMGEDPYEVIENHIKMTNFYFVEVLEISPEKMVAKALSTYYFTKDKCSEETLSAIKTTRLNNAIIMDDMSEVKRLIEEGIDVSKKDTRSSIQSTPLMVAIMSENLPMIRLILLQNPDLSVRNYVDKTALDYAKKSKSKEIKEIIESAY